jgi:DNA-directed RNA polymerase II subunit RPB1
MAYQTEFDFNGNVEKVKGIQFGIMSPERIRQQSVVEVTTHDTFNGNEPVMGGLFDYRMGVLDYGVRCGTDMHTNKECPGYFGHIEMSMPVFFYQYFGVAHKVMKCVCFKCGSLVAKIENEKEKQNILEKNKKNRWAIMFELCKKAKTCPVCEAILPDKYTKIDLCKVVAEWTGIKDAEAKKLMMTPEYTLRTFERMTEETCTLLGFDTDHSHPRSMICQVFPVCPPSCRPSVKQDNGQRMEDDLTIKYCELIKYNTILAEKKKNGSNGKILEDWRSVVQYHAATLIDNEISGVLPAAQRSGRPLKALRQRLKAKEGRIRGNLMGKRVDFSARTVITPDPVIDLNELGVPKLIAQQLTYPEKVNNNNIKELKKLVRNGNKTYPGARSIYQNKSKRTISLNYVDCNQIASKLEIGDIVIRHIKDGDMVLFNRQPSLHKMSMMAHKVRVLDGLTFRLNIAATTPYNADFDGDEMNMHVPQSIATTNELECLASLHRQIISPAHATPIITFVQDCVVGAHLLSMDENAFTHRELMNLMSWNKLYFGSLGTGQSFKNKMYSGIEVLSLVMPDISINIKNKSGENVEIISGKIHRGIFDKKVFTVLIDIIFRDKGPKECLIFFNNTQHVIRAYLMKHTFSVGIKDLILNPDIVRKLESRIEDHKNNVQKRMKTIHLNLFENLSANSTQVEYENKVYQDLQAARSSAENILSEEFKDTRKENRFMNMINSGSKGKIINLAQMTACLGSQAIDGKRVPYGFKDRTLPHFTRYNDGADSRGFVQSSFKKGLNPIEYFFHAMGGREGLIDTAVKTSSTGYLQRKLMKALEDMSVKWNNTVSDANGHIVEYLYGDDASEGTTLEKQHLNIFDDDYTALQLKYKLEKGELIKFLTKESHETMVGYKNWEDVLSKYYTELIDMRKYFIENIAGNTHETLVNNSVNVARLLENCLRDSEFEKTEENFTDGPRVDPVTILKNYDILLGRCKLTDLNEGLWMLKLLLYVNASPKMLISKGIQKKTFQAFLDIIEHTFKQTRVEPGEAVGPIAAQSLGEPCTQLTLNSFHLAGVGSKSNVTRGVPRLQELFHLSKNPKNPSLTVFLKDPFKCDKRAVQKIGSELEITLFKDLLLETSIYYEPDKNVSNISELDREIIRFYNEFESFKTLGSEKTDVKSKWVIRFVFDEKRMLQKGLEMEEVYYAIKSTYKDMIDCIYTDDNASQLIMRIRVNEEDITNDDKLLELKKIETNIINNIVIKGISGITKTVLRAEKRSGELNEASGRFETIAEWILDTDGSNLLDVMTHPGVDTERIFTNDVFECFDVFGVEATRILLVNEIFDVFEDASDVDRRHIQLLVDMMTAKGTLVSIDRNGMKIANTGPLAKCSFEEADQQLYKAALFGDYDDLSGVSGNIMLGQAPPVGTGTVSVGLDEELFVSYLSTNSDKNHKILNTVLEGDELSEIDFEDLSNLESYCDNLDFDFSADF